MGDTLVTRLSTIELQPISSTKLYEPAALSARLLTAHRRRKNLTMSQLARLCELDHSFISRWESGARYPSRKTVTRVITELDLSVQDAIEFYVINGFMPTLPPLMTYAHLNLLGKLFASIVDEEAK